MEFNVFNSSIQHRQSKLKPTITAAVNGATFRFNEPTALLFKKNHVSFIQDKNRPKDWYLVEDTENGFFLSDKSDRYNGRNFRSITLRDDLLKSLGLDPSRSWRFKVASEATETSLGKAYAIITSSAVDVTQKR